MTKELLIYCDESIEKGKFYSDFYGGVLVDSTHFVAVEDALENCKLSLNLHQEIKWTKVTENYLEKYKTLMDNFFDLVLAGKIKVRVMFRQSAIAATNLSDYNRQHGYFLLYYQFIKNAFGLKFANDGNPQPIYLRLFFDELPDSRAKADLFKNHIYSIQNLAVFANSNIKIRKRDIAEVNSKSHVLLQCLDVVLGAMAFRLNNQHLAKQPETGKRGKRTIAKEQLYKHILAKIRLVQPNFNIGISTGTPNGAIDFWQQRYRHWAFLPADFSVDDTKFKKRQ